MFKILTLISDLIQNKTVRYGVKSQKRLMPDEVERSTFEKWDSAASLRVDQAIGYAELEGGES